MDRRPQAAALAEAGGQVVARDREDPLVLLQLVARLVDLCARSSGRRASARPAPWPAGRACAVEVAADVDSPLRSTCVGRCSSG